MARPCRSTFVELLTAMDYNSPDIKEMMDLEHLRAEVPADESGWDDLVAGVKEANLEGESWGVSYVVARASGQDPATTGVASNLAAPGDVFRDGSVRRRAEVG